MKLSDLYHIDLVKVFSFNAASTIVKMLTNIVSLKVVAYMIGPSGVALLGQLTNVSSIFLAFANGGINNGITKYVAEYKDDVQEFRKTISTSFKITIYASIAIGLLLIFLSFILSNLILYTYDYYFVFIIFGFTIIFYALNMFVISVINGLKKFRLYVIISITGSLISLASSLILVLSLGLTGALINAVVFQSVVFIATILLCRKELWFSISWFSQKIDRQMIKKLMGFSLMAITTTILIPMVQLIVRGKVINFLSIEQAGYWEGMNRISTMYLYIIMTAFSIYYLPKLSEISSVSLVRKEIKKCAVFLSPIILCSVLVLFFGRKYIIILLFSDSFLPMQDLFFWQLLGDILKVFSWLFSYLLVSKACVKNFIIAEFSSAIIYMLLSLYMLDNYGIIGLVKSHFIQCTIYLLLMMFFSRNYWKFS